MNPFIELYRDPAGVFLAAGYTVLLLALIVATLTAIAWFTDKGWKHAVWLGNAWEFRRTDQQFGPEWDWYLPPPEVSSHVTRLGLHVTAILFVAMCDLFALGAVAWLLGGNA